MFDMIYFLSMELFNSLINTLISFIAAGILALSTLIASFTPPLVVTVSNPEIQTATTSVATKQVATSTTKKTTLPAPAQKPVATPPVQTIAPIVIKPIPVDLESVNTKTRNALVNILCTTQTGGYLNPISGSGIIVDTRGVILTNAHVGQYFLLRDYPFKNNVDCVIRTGSPAQPVYRAELVYLPPSWISANATQLAAEQALGTGENDYAFLRITGTTNPNGTLPSSFPALTMNIAEPDTNDEMLLAAYPAGFLDGNSIEKNLYISSAVTAVSQLYSFHGTANVDLFSIGGTVVSQAGSSGGASVRADTGTLAGIIATATEGTTTSQRDLHAITISHINRSLMSAGEGGIATLLSGDLVAKAAAFATNVAPNLTAQLEKVLRK